MTIQDRVYSNSGPNLFEITFQMMCKISPDGVICSANESLLEQLGYLPIECNNRSIGDFVMPQQLDLILKSAKHLAEGETSEALRVDLQTSAGEVISCMLRMQCFEGEIVALFVPTKKEAEHIERSIDSFQLISRILEKDAKDSNQFYHYILRELMAIYGYKSGCLRVFEQESDCYTQFQYYGQEKWNGEDWCALRFEDSIDLWSYVKETMLPLTIPCLEDFLKQRGLVGASELQVNNLLLLPILQEEEVKACLLLADCESPISEERIDILSSLLATVWDIVEQKQISRRLARKNDGMKKLYSHLEEGVATYDLILDESKKVMDYRFLDVNRAFFEQIGCGRQLLYGRKGSEFYGQTPAPYLQEFTQVMRTRRSLQFEQFDKKLNKNFHISVFPVGDTQVATIFYDRTSQKKLQVAMQLEKERLAVALSSIGDGVISADIAGRIVEMNRVAESLTGWNREQAIGRLVPEVYRLVDESSKERVEGPVSRVRQSLEVEKSSERVRLLNKRGVELFVSDSASPVRDVSGKLAGIVLVFRDISMQKRRIKEIEHLSFHDSLTGLYNRNFFEKEIDRLNAPRQLPLSIIMGDVNGLKLTNDIYGHQKGDELLKSIAELLRKECRQEDILARWGGDEFILLLPRTSKEAAEEISERLIQSAQKQRFMNLGLSISIGTATKDEEFQNIYDVLAEAEQRMYHKKLLEKNSMRSSIITSLLESLSQKSHETKKHCARLESLAHDIGVELCLTSNEVNDLSLAARLHDVGMVIVADDILQKPSRLTDREWETLKQHSEAGYRICQSVPEVSHVARFVLAHHERMDGSGYPYGLHGEEIPLFSRIIAVADTYDVLTHGRSYSSPKSSELALEELQTLRGSIYDPQVVDALCKLKGKAERVVQPTDIFSGY